MGRGYLLKNTSYMPRTTLSAAPILCLLFLAVASPAFADKEYRTVNAGTYEVVLLRSGRVDLVLPSGGFAFHNARAVARVEGKKARPLPFTGTASARVQYKTRLGQGHGFVVQGKNGTWQLDTYATKPFFTVRLIYTNRGRKTITLDLLQPWTGELDLGPGSDTTPVLAQRNGVPVIATGTTWASDHHIALVNPATGRGLIAGFLEEAAAETTLEVTRELKGKENVFGTFTATVRFDPPLILAPGQSVETPRLYLAVAEPDMLLGLDRFGKALAVVNGVRDARPFVPHGLVLASGKDAVEAGRWLKKTLAPFGYDTLWVTPDAVDEAGVKALHHMGLRVGMTMEKAGYGGVAPDALYVENIALKQRPVPASVYFAADGTPSSLGLTCDGVGLVLPDKADWRAEMTAWARNFYLIPHLLLPQFNAAPLRRPGLQTRLTAIALLGGPVRVTGDPAAMDRNEIDLLRRMLPVAKRPARPMDLFENHAPRVWSLSLGEAHLFGLFNLDGDEAVVVPVFLEAAGLMPGAYYTVYDGWGQQYLGTAKEVLRVSVPPGGVRLLSLRRLENRPMFLANNAHFAQGAMDAEAARWDAAAKGMAGAFDAVAETAYTLTFLAPETQAAGPARVSSGEPVITREGRVVRLRFTPTETGLLRWSLPFTQ